MNTADQIIYCFKESQRVVLGLVDSIYQTFINTVTMIVPILAPFPAAYSIYTAMVGEMIKAPLEIAALTAVAVELIGMFQARTALRSRNWNLVKLKSDPPSPFYLALSMALVYFIVGLLLTISIELEPTAAQYIFPAFVVFAASVYVSNAIASDLTRWETERDDRLRDQEQRRGLAANLRDLSQQLAAVQSQLAESETRAAALREQVARDGVTAAALRDEIAANETRAASLREQVSRLQSQRDSNETRQPTTNGSLSKANESRQQQIAQRREQVRQLRDLDLSNSEMAERLDVSLDTIRRDLEALLKEGDFAVSTNGVNGKVPHA